MFGTNSARVNLIILLVGQVVLIIGYNIFKAEWLFYSNLVFSIVTVGYAFSIRCNTCGKHQVFRGWSFFDLRLPEEKCYFCKNDLNKSTH